MLQGQEPFLFVYTADFSSWLPSLHWTLLWLDKYLVLSPGLNGLAGLRITVAGGGLAKAWGSLGCFWHLGSPATFYFMQAPKCLKDQDGATSLTSEFRLS